MSKLNTNYLNLKENYLFAKISEEKKKYIENNPQKKIIDLSIGDVTLPLTDTIISGINKGLDILSKKETFKGYPPSSGHTFLKEEIIKKDYANIKLSTDEIFISDSSKSDICHILDIFDTGISVAMENPVYPVYLDSNIIRNNNISFIKDKETFLKSNPKVDIIYICSPNNPTGDIWKKELLKKYVDYAIKNDIIIFFDSAYESFITSSDTVHSIYEIDGAKKVAVEFRSFSKSAGYTPLRLAYTIVPFEITLISSLGRKINLNTIFAHLKDIKYNGPSFLSEYGIYELYKMNNLDETKKNIKYYLENVKILSDYFVSTGQKSDSSINSPYIWIKCKDNMDSWDYFYYLLNNYGIIGSPGVGFGICGEKYFRLTGFSSRENTIEAIERLKGSI